MNARIKFDFPSFKNKQNVGKHKIYFAYFDKTCKMHNTENFEFEILDQESPEKIIKNYTKDLDIVLNIVKQKDTILEISNNKIEKKIVLNLCLDKEILSDIYDDLPDESAINNFKINVRVPVCIFALSLQEKYTELNDEQKNTLIISYIRSILELITK